MKKNIPWMLAAILTICGCFMLTGCSGSKWSVSESFFYPISRPEWAIRCPLTTCQRHENAWFT